MRYISAVKSDPSPGVRSIIFDHLAAYAPWCRLQFFQFYSSFVLLCSFLSLIKRFVSNIGARRLRRNILSCFAEEKERKKTLFWTERVEGRPAATRPRFTDLLPPRGDSSPGQRTIRSHPSTRSIRVRASPVPRLACGRTLCGSANRGSDALSVKKIERSQRVQGRIVGTECKSYGPTEQ